jgi:hypothetical protein
MPDLSHFPYAEVAFDRDGAVEGSTDDALALSRRDGVTDLVVLSHGWNNNDAEARDLYGRLARSLREVRGPVQGAESIALLGLFWPSKTFDVRLGLAPAGGGASATGSAVTTDDVLARIEELRTFFDRPDEQDALRRMELAVPDLTSATAKRRFVEDARTLVSDAGVPSEDGPDDFFTKRGDTVMNRLAVPVALAPPEGVGGRAAGVGGAAGSVRPPGGGAAGLRSLVGGALGAAVNALNITTFYGMKERSGVVGANGLRPLLATIRGQRSAPRVHLVGHSFGARLSCAAALGLPRGAIATMSLLQGAFSHFALSDDWDPQRGGKQSGLFAGLLADRTAAGPILVTHSRHDLPVGVAYALASRLRKQVAQAVGDADDIYGGIGRNGAQRTPSALTRELLAVGARYDWTAGVPHNLRADDVIGDHSAVTGPEVAHAVLSAIASTSRP